MIFCKVGSPTKQGFPNGPCLLEMDQSMTYWLADFPEVDGQDLLHKLPHSPGLRPLVRHEKPQTRTQRGSALQEHLACNL